MRLPAKRAGRLAAAALWLLVLAGCHSPEPAALRFGLAQGPVTLDPRFATDATSERIDRLLFARLVDFDPHDRPVPALARWERLAPERYRFTLGSEGRTFHDGTRLTSADVKATYDYLLDPAHASPHRLSLALIERVEAPDPETVEFRLNKPDPLFPAYLVHGILPARLAAAGRELGRAPLGSGPFAFEAWPEEGRVVLRRVRDGQRLELITVKEPTVRVLKLLRGEVDLVQGDLPPELIGYLGRQPGVRVERVAGSNFSYLGFNLEDPATGRPEVRRAVAHAIDRQAIIDHVLGGARPAAALLPPDHWAGNPTLLPPRYDPAEARRLLAAAGYGPERPLHLTYKTSADPFRVRLATILQGQLAAVGIAAEVRSYDWGTFYGDIKAGRFQLYSLSWVGIKTPDIFRYIFHSASLPPHGANRGRYADAEADRLIEAAEQEAEPERQAELYRRLQARLLEDLPLVPLWYEEQVAAMRARVQGYRPARDGDYDALTDVSLAHD